MEEYKSVADKQSNKVRKKHSFKATMFLSPSSKVQTNIYKHFFVVSRKKMQKKKQAKHFGPGLCDLGFQQHYICGSKFSKQKQHIWWQPCVALLTRSGITINH